MLSLQMVCEIERRLAAGEMQRYVARSLGVARMTVGTIAVGRHRHQKQSSRPAMPARPDTDLFAHRCKKCGALVYGDCIACEIRRITEEVVCNLHTTHPRVFRRAST